MVLRLDRSPSSSGRGQGRPKYAGASCIAPHPTLSPQAGERRVHRRASTPAARGTTRRSICARCSAGRAPGGTGARHRAASDRRGRARLEPGSVGARRSRAPPHDAAQTRGAGQDRRSRPAGGVQQPLHVDRRADGRGAEQHRAVRQHQGAARLLLRRLRRQGRAGRQRAAHADPPGQHGPLGRDGDPPQRGQAQARRRAHAERALQRRHASARHHRHHAGVCGASSPAHPLPLAGRG